MTATVKRVGPKPPLQATRAYHYVAPMPAGLADNHIKWREQPLTPPKKRTELWRRKGKRWSEDECDDIQRRHERGETWNEIAESYGTTYASVRAAVDRRTHDRKRTH